MSKNNDELQIDGQTCDIAMHDEVMDAEPTRATDGRPLIHDQVTSERNAKTQEVDFAQLADGSLLELIQSPQSRSETCLAVWNGDKVVFKNEVNSAGTLFKPMPRSGHLQHIRLPNGADPYDSVHALLLKINSVFSKCLDVGDHERFLLVGFVVATWFIERLPVAPYIALVGLPGSGKSTALRILGLLCRRPLLTADISSAAFYQVCDQVSPTLLIDEAATAGNRKALFHLLRSSSSPDTVAFRKNQSFRAFGAKAVTFVELPSDAALNSRFIVLSLHETYRTDLSLVTDPDIMAEAEILQRQLLQYRLECLNRLSLSPTPGDEKLISRNRDLYRALALGCAPWRQFLLRSFTERQTVTREPLFPTHAAVLSHLYHRIHDPIKAGGEIGTVGTLSELINRTLGLIRHSTRLNPREVGAALTALGITRRKRHARGIEVFTTDKDIQRIYNLVGTYGVDIEAFWPSFQACRDCPFCKGRPHPIYSTTF